VVVGCYIIWYKRFSDKCTGLAHMAVRIKSSYHHYSYEFDSFPLCGVLNTPLCEQISVSALRVCRWFSLRTVLCFPLQ
jgi:hypothetical protein